MGESVPKELYVAIRSYTGIVQGNSLLPQGNLDSHFGDGVLFVTYSLLISGSARGASGPTKVEGAAPDVTLRKGTRLYQIVQWLQNGDGDPLIVGCSVHLIISTLVPCHLPLHPGLQNQGICELHASLSEVVHPVALWVLKGGIICLRRSSMKRTKQRIWSI